MALFGPESTPATDTSATHTDALRDTALVLAEYLVDD